MKSIKDRTDYEWCEVYEYVKKEIMGYSPDMKLPQFMVLRLRGLHEGKFLANTNQKSLGNYEYKTILYTFQICRLKILNWFKMNELKFSNEQHRFNSALRFIESEINDVVIRLAQAKKAKEKTDKMTFEYIDSDVADYTIKSTDTKLDDLW